MAIIEDRAALKTTVEREVARMQVTDMHTHLYPPAFGDLLLYGIDELLTYHYLVAEFFRYSGLEYEAFFNLPKRQQADLVYNTLFKKHSPLSEAQRGFLTVLKELGLIGDAEDLEELRRLLNVKSLCDYVDKVFALAGVKEVVMTNDPFDLRERQLWEEIGNRDPRFKAALRLDPLLNSYENAVGELVRLGYHIGSPTERKTVEEIQRFLRYWITKTQAVYLAVSLPPDIKLPEDSCRSIILERAVLPVCREYNLPLALMIGVRRAVNPRLGVAGDSLGKADIRFIEYLCRHYPDNRFLVTMLSRENQHELAVTARKFSNLMVFGCWWFLNNPGIVREITAMRLEILGLSFIPQHSDARVLEHLIYKWAHFRKVMAEVLAEKYLELWQCGWRLTEEDIRRDVERLFRDNFWSFVAGRYGN
ncbi:MAG: glucuronate isomerase [Moorellaceae bacterium]